MYVCWGFCMIENLLCVQYHVCAFALPFLMMCMGIRADYFIRDRRGPSGMFHLTRSQLVLATWQALR